MTAIDWNKPVQTEDGWKVKLLSRDGPINYPYVCKIFDLNRGWIVVAYDDEGDQDPVDAYMKGRNLVNVPEKHELWVNVYAVDRNVHDTREKADEAHKRQPERRIACLRIEFEEGEGLS